MSMIERINRYIISFSFIFSTVVTILTIIYFINEYNKNMSMEIERQYYEKVEITSNILLAFEMLQRQCATEDNYTLFDSFVVTFVEEIDKQFGIYGRVIDKDGRLISRPYAAPDEGDLAILLEAEDFDFERELGFLRDAPTGETVIISRNDVRVHMHWIRYPITDDFYYYILIGIVYDRIMVSVDMDTLTIGVAIILLTEFISMFFAVYWSNRAYRSKLKCDTCPHKIKKQ